MFGKIFGSLATATLLALGAAQQAAAFTFPSNYLFNLKVELDSDKVAAGTGTDPLIYALRAYTDYPGNSGGSGGLPDIFSLIDTITFGNASSPQTQPIDGLFVLGVIDGLLTDPPVPDGEDPTRHLVLLMNKDVPVEGFDFAAVFPGTDDTTITEAQLISSLIDIIQNDTGYGTPDAFASDEAVNAFDTVNTVTKTAYFNFDDGFNVVAFSTGTIIGTGTVSVTAIETPEPASLAVLGLGLAGFAALRRRRA